MPHRQSVRASWHLPAPSAQHCLRGCVRQRCEWRLVGPLILPEGSREAHVTLLSARNGYCCPTIEIAERLCPDPSVREAICTGLKHLLSTVHLLRARLFLAPRFRGQV